MVASNVARPPMIACTIASDSSSISPRFSTPPAAITWNAPTCSRTEAELEKRERRAAPRRDGGVAFRHVQDAETDWTTAQYGLRQRRRQLVAGHDRGGKQRRQPS